MLKAVADRIIIRLDENISSKFLLPDSHNSRNTGTVESIGREVSWVKVGDHVVFHRFDELPLPEENLVVIREKSLLGIYKS